MADAPKPAGVRASIAVGLAVVVGAVGGHTYHVLHPPPPDIAVSTAVVRFSPRGGCTDMVVSELDRASHEVLVQAYSFTSDPIGAALIRAKSRGVAVQVILDRSQRDGVGSETRKLAAVLPVFIDAQHSIAHNKVMILDGTTVITGSFNFTNQAEARNAENLIVLRSQALARSYRDNWLAHQAHSEPMPLAP